MRTIAAVLLAVAVSGVAPPAARAHFNGQPNSSIADAAGPMEAGVTYSGAFGTRDDVDYYKFDVTAGYTVLHFSVRNTVTSCAPDSTCPVWATLLDTAGNQLGGEGSSAGTGRVDAGDSDVIDWTFPTPGTYILVFDSAGDLPTYEFRFDRESRGGGDSGSGGPSGGVVPGPLFTSVSAPKRQRAKAVRGALTVLLPGADVRVALTFNGRTAGILRRRGVRRGRLPFRVPLNRAARRELARLGHLTVTLRVTVFLGGLSARAVRRVTLLAPR